MAAQTGGKQELAMSALPARVLCFIIGYGVGPIPSRCQVPGAMWFASLIVVGTTMQIATREGRGHIQRGSYLNESQWEYNAVYKETNTI